MNRLTLTAVERHLGLAHATFYRHYSDLIAGYFRPRVPRPAAAADGGPADTDETIFRTVRALLGVLSQEVVDG